MLQLSQFLSYWFLFGDQMWFNHNHLLLVKYSIFIFPDFIMNNYCFLHYVIYSKSYYFLNNYWHPYPVSKEHSFVFILFLFLMLITLVNYSIEIHSLNSNLVASSLINFNQGRMMERDTLDNYVYLNLAMIMAPNLQMHSFFTW